MPLPLYQVDAFADRLFTGNPAAVMPLDAWLPDATMQAIAAENNLAETAFFVREGEGYRLRWFTPKVEVDLCGHATLASAHILFAELRFAGETIRFSTQSGILTVTRRGGALAMDFPSRPPKPHVFDEAVAAALGIRPRLFVKARDLVAVYEDPADVAALKPDFHALARLDYFSVLATAPGPDGLDFICRFFAPRAGVDEDPVTGSAYSTLIPYWAGKLKKDQLAARQISERGGNVHCRLLGERVEIAGNAVTFLKGNIEI